MNRLVLPVMLLYASLSLLPAQEAAKGMPTALRGQALVVKVNARITESKDIEPWSSSGSQTTLPGQPVPLKIVGSNLVIAAQFTPYENGSGYTLVAQTQVWVSAGDQGVHYLSTLQTVALALNEKVYFFPLGTAKADEKAPIEIEIELTPYSGENGTAKQ